KHRRHDGAARPAARGSRAADDERPAFDGRIRREVSTGGVPTGIARAEIAARRGRGQEMSYFEVAVIGAGPSGLSCAAQAAELGMSHVLLEAEDHPAHTIYRYQKGKHVMAEPNVLPLRSPLTFTAGKREAVLGAWGDEIRQYRVNVKYRSAVTAISGGK